MGGPTSMEREGLRDGPPDRRRMGERTTDGWAGLDGKAGAAGEVLSVADVVLQHEGRARRLREHPEVGAAVACEGGRDKNAEERTIKSHEPTTND